MAPDPAMMVRLLVAALTAAAALTVPNLRLL